MTSPPELPHIQPGTIWDGVTEYNDGMPEGLGGIYLLRMLRDKTRRFSEWRGTSHPMTEMGRMIDRGWETFGITYTYPYRIINDNSYESVFLGYDGILGLEPVNQYFALNQYQAHAARFAHQLDDAMGHHSLQSATEEDRLTVYHALVFMIGVAAQKYLVWDAVDPEELIVGGVYDGTLLWKRDADEYAEVDRILCGQCDIATFARRFLFHADLPAFRRLHRQGIVYSADRTMDPWAPTLFDVASSPAEDYYEALNEFYHLMLRHYDNVSGVQDHA